MKVKKSEKKDGFMQGIIALMFSQIIIKLLGFFYKWYLTNKEGFGDEGNAIYGAGFAIYALLLTLSSIGVPNAVSKMVSELRAKQDYRGAHRVFKNSFILFSFFGLIGSLLLFFFAQNISVHWIGIEGCEMSLVALSPAIFFTAISSVFRGYFNGKRNLKVTANSQTIEQLSKTFTTILIVELIASKTQSSTIVMAAGANLATTISILISFSYLYKYYKERRKEVGNEIILSKNYPVKSIFKTIKNILAVSIPISMTAILGSLNRNIDSVTVKRKLENFLSVSDALKQYGILSGKVETLIMLPLSFNIAFATVLVPTISADKSNGNIEKARKRIEFSLLITMLIAFPCAVGLSFYAQPILNLLFPKASEGAGVLQLGCITLFFMLIEQTINGALQGMGYIYIPVISLVVGILFKIILNNILIPVKEIGIYGAVIASAVCHGIVLLNTFIFLKKKLDLKINISRFFIKPIISVFGMIVISYSAYILLKSILVEKMVTILSIVIAGLIYIFLVIKLKILLPYEVKMLPNGEKIYNIFKKLNVY